VGIGAALERIEFYTAGYVAVMGAYLGLGEQTPVDLLHLKKAAALRIRLEYTDAASYGAIRFYEGANNKGNIQLMGSAYATASRQNDLEIISVDGDVVLQRIGGPVGIGTSTIPHGGIGYALLALEGPNTSANGPLVQFTTASDDYPLMQIFPWRHDSVGIVLDAYYVGSWRSSDAGSNFAIHKSSDQLVFRYDSGIAQGAVITWNTDCYLDTTGTFHADKLAAAQCHIDQSSPTAGIPVLTVDQADESEEFINFISAAGGGKPIDDTSPALTYYGAIRVAINGVFKRLALYNEVP